MKRLSCAILCILILVPFTACTNNAVDEYTQASTSASSEPDIETTESIIETTENTTVTVPSTETIEATVFQKPENGVYGGDIILGNIKFAIPDEFTVSIIDEETIYLTSPEKDCMISLIAKDTSMLDETYTKEFLSRVKESIDSEDPDGVRLNESSIDGIIAGMNVVMDYYGMINSNLDMTININASFTDSWYTYILMLRSDAKSDSSNEHSITFANFVGKSEYIGLDPRFDFVQ